MVLLLCLLCLMIRLPPLSTRTDTLFTDTTLFRSGGMIANNACGAHSVAWGTTADNVRSLDVLLADGTRVTVTAGGDRHELTTRAGREGELHRQLTGFRSEEHTSELQSLMRISYAVFCLKKTNQQPSNITPTT